MGFVSTPENLDTPVSRGIFGKFKFLIMRILHNLTVEPACFLLSFAGIMDDISLSQMLIYKSCRVDFEFNETVCENLVTDFKEENKMIQNEIAQFNVYVTMVNSVFPIFFAFYLGAWCDVFGRKLCILLYIGAKLISNAGIILTAFFLESPKEWYLFTLIPPALVGGYGALMLGLNAYISDRASPDQRAFRMGMLHMSFALGRPLSPMLGAYLLEKGGFVLVTSASFGITFFGALYMYIRLRSYKWEHQPTEKRSAFSPFHIKDALMTTFKRRPGPNRKFLLLLMLSMLFILVPFLGEFNISYFYVRTRYGWEVEEYSTYSSITSAASIFGQVVLIPLITFLKIRVSLTTVVVIFSVFVRHIVKAFAEYWWLYYLADFLDLIGGYSMSLIRAMVTCCVPMNEFGKIYAVLTAFENLVPIGVSQVYTEVWKLTSEVFPGTVFLLSAAITFLPLAITTYLLIILKGREMSEVTSLKEEEPEKKPNFENYDFFSQAQRTFI